MGAECVGEFTVYKKGWLATLHRNPVKNLILFSYLPTQAHRPIYRDLGALVHSKYLHPSVRHIALIVGTLVALVILRVHGRTNKAEHPMRDVRSDVPIPREQPSGFTR
jgi:hypothetical protein